MRAILNTLLTATFAVLIAACALLQPLGADDEARRGAKITLAAYEALQQAILIYGRLPTCDPEADLVRLCKDRAIWQRIKVAEMAATTTIAEATPVLNGRQSDTGQLFAAVAAIEKVKLTISDAQSKLKGPQP